jgi:zinc transporter 5/7
MIGTIHIQVSGDPSADTKAIQHSVEQVLLSNIPGLSQVAVQVEKEGPNGFQSCFCNGSRLRNGGGGIAGLKQEGMGMGIGMGMGGWSS